MIDLDYELADIKKSGLYRQLHTVEMMDDQAYAYVNGEKMLLLSSNNYLGLAHDPRLIQASIEATKKFGTGSTGSRLTTGNTAVHEKLEERIAEFKQTEAAIVFNTGYMANIAALTTFVGKDDVILSDEMNHASMIDGCRLSRAKTVVYRHVDIEDLELKLKDSAHYRRRLIVTDGVFSMDGNIAPLKEIAELAARYDALLMVDDAHATGVLGKDGRGTAEYFQLKEKIDIHMGTLSKAVGTAGGYIAGSRAFIDYLLNKARPFIFSTSLPAGIAASALTAIDLIELEPESRAHLLTLSRFLYKELSALGYEVLGGETPILSIICGEAETALSLSQALYENGIFVPAIRPPTVPAGTSRIRLTVSAVHQVEQINQVLQVLKKMKGK